MTINSNKVINVRKNIMLQFNRNYYFLDKVMNITKYILYIELTVTKYYILLMTKYYIEL